MKAQEYYSDEDSEMADVIIDTQNELKQIVAISLHKYNFPTDDQTINDTIKELCLVTLA